MDTNSLNGQMTSAQKLQLAFAGLTIIILIGMSGFMLIENLNPIDALYMTIITLSTVGFGEVTTLHPSGRIFVIFLILFGVMFSGFVVTILGQFVMEGQFNEIYGRKKMERKISKMTNHYIIAGYGRVGRQVAIEFKKKNVQFVVIERDIDSVPDLYKDSILFIQGEATEDDILRKAGIETANTLISTLPDEAQNVYLTLTARFMNKGLHIIGRADYEEGIIKLKRAGADHVVTPHVLGGIRMAMATLRPNVVDFMHSTSLGESGLTIEEMRVPEGSSLSGKSLKDSNLKQDFGVTIIGVKKTNQDMIIAPGPNIILDANDIMVLIGHEDGLENISKSFT